MESERLQLLRTIADNPADDFPRLVYADWLEENGEAQHAELIRVQVELSKPAKCEWADDNLSKLTCDELNDRQPEYRVIVWCPTCRRQQALKARELYLFAQLNIYHPNRFATWDRGLVVAIECNSASLVKLGPGRQPHHPVCLYHQHPIRTVKLTDWHGLDRSLPPNPREALPFLKRLLIPRGDHYEDTVSRWEQASAALPGVECVVGHAPGNVTVAINDETFLVAEWNLGGSRR